MQIQKLIRQFGEHGNEYSPIEVGDKINEIIDFLTEPIEPPKENKVFLKNRDTDEVKEVVDPIIVTELEEVGDVGKHQPEPTPEPLGSTVVSETKNHTPIEVKLEGVAVRSPSTQDMVYLVKKGKKHWIKNPETLRKLGFDFHKVKNITNQEMTSYETGKPIDLKEKSVEVKKTQDEFDKYSF